MIGVLKMPYEPQGTYGYYWAYVLRKLQERRGLGGLRGLTGLRVLMGLKAFQSSYGR